jgi:hypothetical protein
MSTLKKYAAATTLAGMITVSAFVGHSSIEHGRNLEAIQKVETTINSSCFENEMLSSSVDAGQMNGLSKKQVIEKMRSSKTTIELELYRSWKNTVGYTFSSTKRIWMNRKFHDKFNACQVAANLAHELTHKLGFKHDLKATKRRPYSVPYVTGDIIKKCCV